MSDLDQAISLTLEVEGKWSDHPQDFGGKTMYGITEATYNEAVRRGIIHPMGLRNLKPWDALTIYDIMYWKVIRGDALPRGLNILVFDIQVNSGRGGKTLQRSLSALGAAPGPVDGIIGGKTLEAVTALCDAKTGLYGLMNEVSARRFRFWTRLGIFKTFGFGWFRRGIKVHTHAVRMACGEV